MEKYNYKRELNGDSRIENTTSEIKVNWMSLKHIKNVSELEDQNYPIWKTEKKYSKNEFKRAEPQWPTEQN